MGITRTGARYRIITLDEETEIERTAQLITRDYLIALEILEMCRRWCEQGRYRFALVRVK